MKKTAFLLLLILLLLLGGCGADAPSFDLDSYEGRVIFFQYDNLHDPHCDLCMIGDSLTQYYDLNRYFPTLSTKNRGICGDTTTSLLARLDASIEGMRPKITLLLIGANNVDTFQDDYEELVVGIMEKLSNSSFYLISMTPTCKAYQGYMPAIRQNNEFIVAISRKYSLGYIDLYSALLDEDTGLLREEYTVEGQHFNETGYEVITQVLSSYFLK